ncbi:HAAS signaling domain-containing protein [Modestobacter marinus]|uniref:HAAS signaling domain-containing protein n=1 Tax=Modestobacter marinus TaxID=477641 RepID=UPI001C95957F|nr:hypothetical protein [Modestobacter marinus]
MEYRLTTTDQAWCDDLLLALRVRDVPGARIGEVLAEVQSHLAETGEEPRDAFGAPREYADQVAAALGVSAPDGVWRQLVRGLSWRDLAGAAVIGVATYLLADGLWSLGAGESAVFGLPSWLVALAALLVLGVATARIVTAARSGRDDDAVIDPRTGADMVGFPRSAVALLVGVPLLSLAAMLVGGYLVGW